MTENPYNLGGEFDDHPEYEADLLEPTAMAGVLSEVGQELMRMSHEPSDEDYREGHTKKDILEAVKFLGNAFDILDGRQDPESDTHDEPVTFTELFLTATDNGIVRESTDERFAEELLELTMDMQREGLIDASELNDEATDPRGAEILLTAFGNVATRMVIEKRWPSIDMPLEDPNG
jgi:hypothetical protein